MKEKNIYLPAEWWKKMNLRLARLWCYFSTHTHTHEFTVQGRDDNREESASTVPCPEPEKLPGGQASVSTPLQSASDSPSLEKATPATPTSSSHGLPSGEEPAQGGADSAEAVVDDVFSTADEVLLVPDSPQKEFHCAVVRALSKEPSVVEAAKADLAPDPEEPEEEPKGQKPTTPPSTPVKAEEESLPEQTYKDESDAATLRQTLPDLTPDDPSDAPALPAEDSASAPATADADGAEGEEPADAGDQEGEESPSKSPSKKKKKFRTPSFLKKNKKKTES